MISGCSCPETSAWVALCFSCSQRLRAETDSPPSQPPSFPPHDSADLRALVLELQALNLSPAPDAALPARPPAWRACSATGLPAQHDKCQGSKSISAGSLGRLPGGRGALLGVEGFAGCPGRPAWGTVTPREERPRVRWTLGSRATRAYMALVGNPLFMAPAPGSASLQAILCACSFISI